MTRDELTDICDAYEKEETSKHWSDQCGHHVIEQDGGVMRAHPAHQSERNPDGPPMPGSRMTIEPGCSDIALGREYHVPHDVDIWKARGLLCWGRWT